MTKEKLYVILYGCNIDFFSLLKERWQRHVRFLSIKLLFIRFASSPFFILQYLETGYPDFFFILG